MALIALSLSIARNANEDLLAAIKKEQSRKPLNADHKLGDVEIHQVLGESISPEAQKLTKKIKIESRFEDLIGRAKIMAVFAKVIAPLPPEDQAELLVFAAVLMAAAVPLTIASLSRLEYLGQIMEARELNEGFLNRNFQNVKKLSPEWHLLAHEVTSRSQELMALSLKLADLLPSEICDAAAIAAPIAIVAAMAKLSVELLPEYNIDSHLGLLMEKTARGAFRFMPEVIIFAKYATSGRVLGDGIEALGTSTEQLGESIKQIPFLGIVADLGKRMFLWALEGAAVGIPMIGLDKGAQILAEYNIPRETKKFVKFACAGAMCTGLAVTPIDTAPYYSRLISLSPKRYEATLKS